MALLRQIFCEVCCPQGKPKEKRKKSSRHPGPEAPPHFDQAAGYPPGSPMQVGGVPPGFPPVMPQDMQYEAPYLKSFAVANPGEGSRLTQGPDARTLCAEGSNDAADYDMQVCEELRMSARMLEGPVQKHPSTGKGLLKRAQDRYVAVLPAYDLPSASELAQWQSGILAWWDDAAAFRQGARPKGAVPLLKIAKVDSYREDKTGKSVLVKHKTTGMNELVLVFPSNRDAEEWSYILWEMIALIRGETPSC